MAGWRIDEAANLLLRFHFDAGTPLKDELSALGEHLKQPHPDNRQAPIKILHADELLRIAVFQKEVTEKLAAAEALAHPAAIRLGGEPDKTKAALMATPTIKKIEAILSQSGYSISFMHLEKFRKNANGGYEGDMKLVLQRRTSNAQNKSSQINALPTVN